MVPVKGSPVRLLSYKSRELRLDIFDQLDGNMPVTRHCGIALSVTFAFAKICRFVVIMHLQGSPNAPVNLFSLNKSEARPVMLVQVDGKVPAEHIQQ